MLEVNESALQEIRREISRLAKTEQEIRDVLWLIVRSDWEGIFTDDLVQCAECKQFIQYRSVAYSEPGYAIHYCGACWQKEEQRTCIRCWSHFTSQTLIRGDRCLPCRSGICAVCKQAALPLEYTPGWSRAICPGCLQSLGLHVDWEARELRKLSAHATRFQSSYVPLREWVTTLQDHAWLCAYCRNRPYEQIDHFIPLCKKGMNTIKNCIPACKPCNDIKGQRLPQKVISIPQEDINRVRLYLQSR